MSEMLATQDRPDTAALAEESMEIVRAAEVMTVADADGYRLAVEFGKGVKALQKRIVDKFAPHKKRAYDAWKGLCDDEHSDLKPTEEAEGIVKTKLLTFQRAERDRLAVEQKAKEAQQRKLDEERQLQEAIDLEEDGDPEGAAAVLDEPPAPVFIPAPQRATPKVSGAAETKRWTFNETTIRLASIIRHIAGVPQDQPLAHPEFVNLLALNAKTTRSLITGMRGDFNVPGIDAYEEDGISLSSK